MTQPHIKVRKSNLATYKPWVAVIRDNRKSTRFWQRIFHTWEEAITFALKDAVRAHYGTTTKEPQ